MRAVIAGGAGFLGSHLTERLLAEGWDVTVIDSYITGSRGNLEHMNVEDHRLRIVAGDITNDLDGVMNPLNSMAIGDVDWALNLASPASPVAYGDHPIETLRAGSLGTLNMLDRACEWGASYLHASTSEVYGDPLVHPQPEGYWGNVNPVGWRSCYDESKRFSEAAVVAYQKQNGLDVRIPRIFNTYGPRMALDDGRPVVTFIRAALEGRPLPVQGDGLQTRSFCYVDDMVEALYRLIGSGWTQPINVGSTHEISIRQLAYTVIELIGGEIEYVPRVGDDPQQRRPDVTRAGLVLEWEPQVSLVNGIERTIEWVRRELGL